MSPLKGFFTLQFKSSMKFFFGEAKYKNFLDSIEHYSIAVGLGEGRNLHRTTQNKTTQMIENIDNKIDFLSLIHKITFPL